MNKIPALIAIFFVSTTLQQNESGYFRDKFVGNGQTSQVLRKILSNYDNFVRPRSNSDPQKPTEVIIWMRILDMTWKDDEIIFKMLTKRRWTDERLKFTTTEAGKEHISLPLEEFANYIWHPETTFIFNHEIDDVSPGTIRIYHNGTIEDKRIRTVRVFTPAIRDKSTIIQGSLDVTDLRYDRRGLNMTWPPNSPEACMIVHSEEKVRFEYITCSKDYKTINGRQKEILTATFAFIRKI